MKDNFKKLPPEMVFQIATNVMAENSKLKNRTENLFGAMTVLSAISDDTRRQQHTDEFFKKYEVTSQEKQKLLLNAVETDNKDVIHLLKDIEFDKERAFIDAVRDKNLNTVKWLIENEHIAINHLFSSTDEQPLQIAAIFGNKEIVEYLLGKGATVENAIEFANHNKDEDAKNAILKLFNAPSPELPIKDAPLNEDKPNETPYQQQLTTAEAQFSVSLNDKSFYLAMYILHTEEFARLDPIKGDIFKSYVEKLDKLYQDKVLDGKSPEKIENLSDVCKMVAKFDDKGSSILNEQQRNAAVDNILSKASPQDLKMMVEAVEKQEKHSAKNDVRKMLEKFVDAVCNLFSKNKDQSIQNGIKSVLTLAKIEPKDLQSSKEHGVSDERTKIGKFVEMVEKQKQPLENKGPSR